MKKDDRLEISIKFNFFGIAGPTGEGIIKFIDFVPPTMNKNEFSALIKLIKSTNINMDMEEIKKLTLELCELEFRKLLEEKK